MVRQRRLSLFGHVARMPDNVPVKAVLRVACDVWDGVPPFPNWRRPGGRPPITGLCQICSDCGLSAGRALNCAQDRSCIDGNDNCHITTSRHPRFSQLCRDKLNTAQRQVVHQSVFKYSKRCIVLITLPLNEVLSQDICLGTMTTTSTKGTWVLGRPKILVLTSQDWFLPVYTIHASEVRHSGSNIFTDLHQSFDCVMWAMFT